MMWRAVLILSLPALSLIMAHDIGRLRKTLAAGNVYALFPDDNGYSQAAQAYNGRFIIGPIAIAYPKNAEQVSTTIVAGAEQNIRVVSRSGGHSYIANGLGGKNGSLVVDMSNFSNLTLDSSTNLATIQPGLRLGDIALMLNDRGRAIPHGHCSTVGLGGHAAYGSWGFVSRQWGLTLDHIVSAQLVLANRTITTVSEDNNPELFWGIRGSASSFGIVTYYEFSTVAVPEEGTYFVYDWNVSVAEASTFLTSLQGYVQSGIPSTLGIELRLLRGNIAGNLSITLDGAYFGSHDSFTKTIKPYLDALVPPGLTTITQGNWIETVAALTYGTLNTSTQAPINDTFYAKSLLTPEDSPLSKVAVDALMSYLDTAGFRTTDVFWFVEIELYGGSNSAINTVPVDQTAFAHRNKLFNIQLYATSVVPPYPKDGFAFLNSITDVIISNSPREWHYGAYINYPDNRLDDWQDLYYGSHYARLQALKKKFDPSNVFSFPLAIEGDTPLN
ncbi:glucooligosaccharide oxidase [Guyanagaster necrorhizus]|uniref:Glucooligosaccharide oxidase n=1 Tax=Guyanagaster necrorhizus TaxID=856835 RepID=A0A9P8AYW7_9AGAR|nr:glucooligosaccharide oxidase [Guyanagaster necrorhizus MCA 3950]KAG7452930.1 glucooligosaccharide oxidase [Guyanagaster necrorhizus MCA 3950]